MHLIMKEKVGKIKKSDLLSTIRTMLEKGKIKFPLPYHQTFAYASWKKLLEYISWSDSGYFYLLGEFWNKYHVASFSEEYKYRGSKLVANVKITYINPEFIK